MEKIDISQIAREYGLKIISLARRMIRNEESAKDAAQEVWYEILGSIGSFRGDSHVSTWIYTIAKRTILRSMRKERTISSRELDEHFSKPEITYEGDKSSRSEWVREKCDYCLSAFCNCIAPEQRLVYLFREIIGLSNDSIAQIMETSEENVRKMWSRSRLKVMNFMSRNCILYNQDASCSCRIKKEVIVTNFHAMFAELKKTADLFKFYLRFEETLPRKNFFLSRLPDVTKTDIPPLNR